MARKTTGAGERGTTAAATGAVQPPQPAANPNMVLAELVTAKLKDSTLVPSEKVTEICAKVATGEATSEDWRLWIDLARAKPQGGPNNGTP
jgi:hypothetical protein